MAPTCNPLSNQPTADSPFSNAATPSTTSAIAGLPALSSRARPTGAAIPSREVSSATSRSHPSSSFPPAGHSTSSPRKTLASTSPFIPGVAFGVPTTCLTNAAQPFTLPGITPPFGCTGNLGRDKFTMPYFFQFDLRVSKGISFGERFRLDLIADAFNLFNHTNISAVNQLCDTLVTTTCAAGQPTAAFDARQFQFALKLNW
jgi:hypothetical protein